MSSQNHADRLAAALEATGMIEVVDTQFKTDQVTIVFRVTGGNEGRWTPIIARLEKGREAQVGQAHYWDSLIAKRYFLKEGKLVYAWMITIRSNVMSDSLDYFMRALKAQPQQSQSQPQTDGEFAGELTEFPLPGAEHISDRNAPKPGSKKGVYRAGTVPIR